MRWTTSRLTSPRLCKAPFSSGIQAPLGRPIPHLGLVMEDQQELVEGIRGRPRPVDQAEKTGVPSEHSGILNALAPCRLNQDQGMELVERAEAPPAPSNLQTSAHQFLKTQGQHRLRDQNDPRASRQIHRLRSGFKHNGQNALAHVEGVSRQVTGPENTTARYARLHPMGAAILNPAGPSRPLGRNQGRELGP